MVVDSIGPRSVKARSPPIELRIPAVERMGHVSIKLYQDSNNCQYRDLHQSSYAYQLSEDRAMSQASCIRIPGCW